MTDIVDLRKNTYRIVYDDATKTARKNNSSKFRPPKMLRHFAFLVSFLLIALTFMTRPVEVSARQENADDKEFLRKIRDKVLKEIEGEKEVYESQMALLIDEMVAECKLNDAQKLKLQVAAKGAIQQAMKEFTVLVGGAFQMLNLPNVLEDGGAFLDEIDKNAQDKNENSTDPNAEDDEEDEDKFNAPNVRQQGAWILQSDFLAWCRNSGLDTFSKWKSPRMHPIWIKAIKTTLTPEQSQTMTQKFQRRQDELRKSIVDSFIARVDVDLVLKDDQKVELRKYVDSKYGKALAAVVWKSDSNHRNVVQNTQPSAEVKEILSEKQLKLWTHQFAGQLQSCEMKAAQMEVQENKPNQDAPGIFQQLIRRLFF